jgi:SNF2 family DNA or RNA helicase
MQTRAYIAGARIYLHTEFSNLLLCKRIPGAAWDTEKRAWSYPATPLVARLIRGSFRGLDAGDTLVTLANRQPRPATPTPIPPPTVLPQQPPPPVPATIPNLKTSPWKHQVLAFQFLQPLLLPTGGAALLAMGMGTGKSLTTIGAMCNMVGPDEPVLIISPLRVVDVWPNQIRLHAGVPIRVLALGDDAGTVAKKTDRAAEAVKLAALRHERLAIVINYESLWRDPFAKWALSQKWGLVICDESHRIKKPSGKASMYLARMRPRAKYRLALTGTPMPHSPLDIYGQFRFLDDRILGRSYHAFKQRFAVMGGFQQKQVVAFRNIEELEALMRTITFRVGKDVLDLPPETHVTYHCDLTPEGARAYRSLEKDFIAEVKEGLVTAANAMVKLLRLQQITGGTVKTDDGRYAQVDQSKQKLLADTLEDIGTDAADAFEPSGEPVVVFCRFHSDMDAVHAAAKENGFTSMELSGRRDELKEWQDGKAQVLAVQISAGGVGVDLTRARYNIYYSLSFSLGEYDQSLSRVHRPGQTRPVTHIHLVVRGTVDEKIIRALEQRAEVIESILKEIKEQK